jgi:hypothetical protein
MQRTVVQSYAGSRRAHLDIFRSGGEKRDPEVPLDSVGKKNPSDRAVDASLLSISDCFFRDSRSIIRVGVSKALLHEQREREGWKRENYETARQSCERLRLRRSAVPALQQQSGVKIEQMRESNARGKVMRWWSPRCRTGESAPASRSRRCRPQVRARQQPERQREGAVSSTPPSRHASDPA